MLHDFLQLHGADMAACPDTYLGVDFPERPTASDLEKDALKGVITFVLGVLIAALSKNPTLTKGATAVAGSVAAGWMIRNLPGPIPAHVEWIRVRDLMGVD